MVRDALIRAVAAHSCHLILTVERLSIRVVVIFKPHAPGRELCEQSLMRNVLICNSDLVDHAVDER